MHMIINHSSVVTIFHPKTELYDIDNLFVQKYPLTNNLHA